MNRLQYLRVNQAKHLDSQRVPSLDFRPRIRLYYR